MITSPPRLLPMASHGCSCCGPASRADTASTPATSDSSAGGSSPSYQVTGLIEVSYQGRTGTTEFSTTDDGATCVTDLRLT